MKTLMKNLPIYLIVIVSLSKSMKTLAIILALAQLLCSCTTARTIYGPDISVFDEDEIYRDKSLRIRTKDGRKTYMEFISYDGQSIYGSINYEVQGIRKRKKDRVYISDIESIENLEGDALKTFGLASLVLGIVVISKSDIGDYE